MLAPLETRELLLAHLADLLPTMDWSGRPGLASIVLELPLSDMRNAVTRAAHCFRFSSPARHETRIGSSAAYRLEFRGRQRLDHMRSAAQQLSSGWTTLDPDGTGVQPSALIAFSHYPDILTDGRWKGFPNSLLWVPSVLLHQNDTIAAAVFTAPCPTDPAHALAQWEEQLTQLLKRQPPSHQTTSRLRRIHNRPAAQAWQRQVQSALAAIRDTSLEKLVLTRQIRVRGERPFDAQRLHSALAWLFPDCQVLQIRMGGRIFTAATPERLVALDRGNLRVDAIAGTTARAANTELDTELAQALRRSPKQQHEHQLVVQSIRERLAPLTTSLDIPTQPGLLPLSNVQHLWTPITGRTAHGQDLLSLAAALHPTPATSGYPVAAAQHWLKRHDPFERGWYTGVAGWMTPDQEGELWVLLRCALLEGDCAELYAGAGITADSNPEDEWRETEDKLSGMLAALKYA